MSDNGNGKVPIKIIQLLIEKMELGIQNSQQRIDKEIEELTEAMTSVVNRINTANKILIGKLEIIKNRVSRMILVALIVFAMLMASVALSVFGAQLLYEHNTKAFMEKISKQHVVDHNKYQDEKNITKEELKKIVLDCLKELKEEE